MTEPNEATQEPARALPFVVVTLVHGTWAGDAAWTKDGSPFRRALENQLGSRVRFYRFKWSGSNSHDARLTAGKELSDYLWQRIRESPEARQVVAAHSHGGNVLLYALRDTALQDKVSAAICMGTPFLYCVGRNIQEAIDFLRSYKVAVLVSIFFAAVLLGGVSMEALNATFPGWDENSTLAGLFIAGWWTGIISCWLLFWRGLRDWPAVALRTQQRVIEELQPPQVTSVPFLCVSFAGDEAAVVLNVQQTVANVPFWLWRFMERLQSTGLDRVFPFLCFTLLVMIILGALGVQVPSIAMIGVFGLALGSILFTFLGGPFLMAGLMALMPAAKFARAHRFGFGWEPAVNHVLVHVVQRPEPATVSPGKLDFIAYSATEAAMRLGLSARAFRIRHLLHSLIYSDPKVTGAVARRLESYLGAR